MYYIIPCILNYRIIEKTVFIIIEQSEQLTHILKGTHITRYNIHNLNTVLMDS